MSHFAFSEPSHKSLWRHFTGHRGLLVAVLLGGLLFPQSAHPASGIGLAKSKAYGIAVQPDDRVVVTGSSRYVEASDLGLITARYNDDGSLDFGFSDDGVIRTRIGTEWARDAAIQNDGRIVVVGATYDPMAGTGMDIAVVRYTADGVLDSTFGGDGIVATNIGLADNDEATGVAIQSDGKIVVVGRRAVSTIVILRYATDGTLDPSFGSGGIVTTPLTGYNVVGSMALQADGMILVAERSDVLRYDTNGVLDPAFDGDGHVTAPVVLPYVSDLAVQDDGKILVLSLNQLIRYDTNGSPDSTFGGDGVIDVTLDSPRALAIRPDGRIVVLGHVDDDGTSFALRGYLPDASPDPGLGLAGEHSVTLDLADVSVADLALKSDGRIVVIGTGARSNVLESFLVVEMEPDGTLNTAFDHDGVVKESDCRRIPLDSASCITPGRATLTVKAGSETARRRFNWKWRGDETGLTYGDLGQPNLATQYTLCIYDSTASLPTLSDWINFEYEDWRDKPSVGWNFRHAFGEHLGIVSLEMKPVAAGGLPSVRFRYGVANTDDVGYTPLPDPISAAAYFDQDPGVTIQLVSSDGLCIKSEFTASGTKKNDGANFVAKLP